MVLQALFRGAVTIAGVVVRGFRSSSVPVTHDGCLVESRTPLWVGFSLYIYIYIYKEKKKYIYI